MHDGDGLVTGKDLVQPRPVKKVALLERSELHRTAPAGAQVVVSDRHEARVTQCLGRAAGGQKFDMVGGQGGGQFKQAGLVGNGQQCPADFHGRAGQEVGGHGEVFQEGSRL